MTTLPRPIDELPGASALPDRTTFPDAFRRTVAAFPDEPALRTPGGAVELTWSEVAERVDHAARVLAGLGVGRGDTVALMLTNRPEFHVLDLAALHLGATPFSVYTTCPPDQIAHVLDNAGSRVVVTQQAFLAAVQAAQAMAPQVTTVVSLDGGADVPVFDELAPTADLDLESAWRAVEPDDVAVLIYTSGTTGPPKGVQLTHRGLMAAFRGVSASVPAWRTQGRLVSYLPHAHLADRFFSHYPALITGASITCVDDPKAAIAALPEIRPTLFLAVPRIWEKLKTVLEGQIPPGAGTEVHAAIRAKLGLDAAEALVSGAAPIGADVLEFFASIGLEILEGYGMSECSAVISINRPGDARIGSVGQPVAGVELRLAEDGEILVRGELVMAGYRDQPEKTAEAVDPDGWLATGDVGVLDEDGFLRIVDRKKELLINAAGKNMSPANIENTVKASSPLIGQAVAIGDRRPYVTALLLLDPDAAAAHAAQHGLADATPAALARDQEILGLVEEAVQQANARLSRVEQLKRWTLLPQEWLPGGDELTPTSKLRRRPIAEKYADEIEAMYAQ